MSQDDTIPQLPAKGQVALRVLRELGVLFETPCAPEPGPGSGWGPAAPADHVFFRHVPLWQYEDPLYARPFAEPGRKPVYETLDPDTPLEAVLARTHLVVLLGAADTPTFRRCLATPGVFLLIFEPDPVRLAEFALRVPAAQLAKRATILHGEPLVFMPPLSEILPASLFQLGFPVFYVLPGLKERLAEAGQEPPARFATMLEILFFRHCVYHLSGQANHRSLPLRPMARGLFYDQQLHSYANLTAYATRPDIRPLRKAFMGETAVLVAAGPDLPERLELIGRLRERCVVIAVNNALKPLLAAGVRPHFVVANDTSVHTARSWEGLPRLDDVALVGHCLIDLGEAVFPRAYLFGVCQPELFGTRPSLRLHGSVITTAFSLAKYMGCSRCVLAGVQLCSSDPWTLGYSRGSIHEKPAAAPRPRRRPRGRPSPTPSRCRRGSSRNSRSPPSGWAGAGPVRWPRSSPTAAARPNRFRERPAPTRRASWCIRPRATRSTAPATPPPASWPGATRWWCTNAPRASSRRSSRRSFRWPAGTTWPWCTGTARRRSTSTAGS